MTPIRPRDRRDGQGADLRKLLGDDDRHANIMAAYSAYANRTVLGLGITTDGDDVDTAPPQSDDVTEWRQG